MGTPQCQLCAIISNAANRSQDFPKQAQTTRRSGRPRGAVCDEAQQRRPPRDTGPGRRIGVERQLSNRRQLVTSQSARNFIISCLSPEISEICFSFQKEKTWTLTLTYKSSCKIDSRTITSSKTIKKGRRNPRIPGVLKTKLRHLLLSHSPSTQHNSVNCLSTVSCPWHDRGNMVGN